MWMGRGAEAATAQGNLSLQENNELVLGTHASTIGGFGLSLSLFPETSSLPHCILHHLVTPVQSPGGSVDRANITLRMLERGLAVDSPDRPPSEELSPMLCQGTNLERFCSSDRLAPAKSLYHESVERVPKCACGAMNGGDPTVDRAVRIPDMLGLTCSKLEDQERLAVPAENMGTFVLIRVPGELQIWRLF